MRAVLQRVSSASVTVGEETVGRCGKGLLILLGVEKGDGEEAAGRLAAKIAGLRVFEDEKGKMNLPPVAVGAEFLVISNFTLCADCRRGNRPDFFSAEAPEEARRLYEYFTARLSALSGCPTSCGRFGADMKVALVNDGPVTLVIDSDRLNAPKNTSDGGEKR